LKEYAVYKGEELLCVGDVVECAETLGVKITTIYNYAAENRRKRAAKSKNPDKWTLAYALEKDAE
jgi:undecaprenyl pyrophosphate synthase